jgi:hypothetical protein
VVWGLSLSAAVFLVHYVRTQYMIMFSCLWLSDGWCT